MTENEKLTIVFTYEDINYNEYSYVCPRVGEKLVLEGFETILVTSVAHDLKRSIVYLTVEKTDQ
jgi:hypothetical protein